SRAGGLGPAAQRELQKTRQESRAAAARQAARDAARLDREPRQDLRIFLGFLSGHHGGADAVGLPQSRDRAPRAVPAALRQRIVALERDDFSSNRRPALPYCRSMIFSENRDPLFGIML